VVEHTLFLQGIESQRSLLTARSICCRCLSPPPRLLLPDRSQARQAPPNISTATPEMFREFQLVGRLAHRHRARIRFRSELLCRKHGYVPWFCTSEMLLSCSWLARTPPRVTMYLTSPEQLVLTDGAIRRASMGARVRGCSHPFGPHMTCMWLAGHRPLARISL
jgi:hypothetical protein